MGHTHCCCDHVLAYCQVCDVAYCTKCGREWYAHRWTYHHNDWVKYVEPTITWSGATITDSNTGGGHEHS